MEKAVSDDGDDQLAVLSYRIFQVCGRIEEALERIGATGNGLGEKIRSVRISYELSGRIRAIARDRNELAHNAHRHGYSARDLTFILASCEDALRALGDLPKTDASVRVSFGRASWSARPLARPVTTSPLRAMLGIFGLMSVALVVVIGMVLGARLPTRPRADEPTASSPLPTAGAPSTTTAPVSARGLMPASVPSPGKRGRSFSITPARKKNERVRGGAPWPPAPDDANADGMANAEADGDVADPAPARAPGPAAPGDDGRVPPRNARARALTRAELDALLER